MSRVSTTTLSLTSSEESRSSIEQRLPSGDDGSTSEYVRDPLRRGLEAQASRWLRAHIEEGLQSGPGREWTPDVKANVKKRALGDGA